MYFLSLWFLFLIFHMKVYEYIISLDLSSARAAYYLCPNTLLQLCGYPFQHYNSWRYNVWQSEDIVICSLRADNLRSLDIIEHRNSGSDIRGRWSQFQANVLDIQSSLLASYVSS